MIGIVILIFLKMDIYKSFGRMCFVSLYCVSMYSVLFVCCNSLILILFDYKDSLAFEFYQNVVFSGYIQKS